MSTNGEAKTFHPLQEEMFRVEDELKEAGAETISEVAARLIGFEGDIEELERVLAQMGSHTLHVTRENAQRLEAEPVPLLVTVAMTEGLILARAAQNLSDA